jgi:hypothetical protein
MVIKKRKKVGGAKVVKVKFVTKEGKLVSFKK